MKVVGGPHGERRCIRMLNQRESDPDPQDLSDAAMNDKHIIRRLHEPVVSWSSDGIPCSDVQYLLILFED